MPPKKRITPPKTPTKITPRAKNPAEMGPIKPQGPSPDLANNPIPMRTNEESLNALIPYLALGFAPVETSGGNALCGLNALTLSLKAALNVHKFKNGPQAKEITAAALKKILNSAEYQKTVQKQLDDPSGPFAGMKYAAPDAWQDHMEAALATSYLNIEGIRNLLKLANEKWNMNFELGYITAGFQCRYDTVAKAYDNNFIRETTANVTAMNRPVVWIYNTGAGERIRAYTGSYQPGPEHWEGMATVSYTTGKTRRQIVNDWALQQQIIDDMDTGVWRATENIAGDDIYDQPVFFVQAGHFLRDMSLPNPTYARAGHRYMRLCNIEKFNNSEVVSSEGFVHEDQIVKMELTSKPGPPRPAVKPPPNSGENDEKDAKDKKKRAKKETTEEMRNVKRFFTTIKQDPDNLRFKILRAVELSDKIGNFIDLDILNGSDAARPVPGHFFLDTGARLDVARAYVTDIEGNPGFIGQTPIELRSLQALTYPWGLPEYLPRPPESGPAAASATPSGDERASDSIMTRFGLITPKSTSSEIRRAARALGHMHLGGNKFGILTNMIQEEAKRAAAAAHAGPRYLPMYRLKDDVSRAGANGSAVDFLKDEIVLVYLVEKEGAWIVDYEGNKGRVKESSLTAIDKAWGIEVDLTKMDVGSTDVKGKRKATDDAPLTPVQKKTKMTIGLPTPAKTPKASKALKKKK